MMKTTVLIQCIVFMASYVYCARQPPRNPFKEVHEDICVAVNPVLSRIYYRSSKAVRLDMVCETESGYELISQATPKELVIRIDKTSMRIYKANYDVTLINFVSVKGHRGQATLFFESFEDAKYFNRLVYPELRRRLKFFQIVGRVNRYFTTQPELGKNTVATRYAKFFFEDGREPINFVVEADGIAQPVLIFMQGEFQITIHESQRNNIRKALMSIAKTTFEIHFDSAKEGRIFVDEMGQYSKEGRYLVAR